MARIHISISDKRGLQLYPLNAFTFASMPGFAKKKYFSHITIILQMDDDGEKYHIKKHAFKNEKKKWRNILCIGSTFVSLKGHRG